MDRYGYARFYRRYVTGWLQTGKFLVNGFAGSSCRDREIRADQIRAYIGIGGTAALAGAHLLLGCYHTEG
jgi:hypothetical protein